MRISPALSGPSDEESCPHKAQFVCVADVQSNIPGSMLHE